jgi:hypothetical protein
VLVLSTLGAPQRSLLRGRRARPAVDAPAPVATTRATIVRAGPLDPDAAARWLGNADGDVELHSALGVLNRVLHLHRVASADPSARDVSREQMLVARIGFGSGEQVADGRW